MAGVFTKKKLTQSHLRGLPTKWALSLVIRGFGPYSSLPFASFCIFVASSERSLVGQTPCWFWLGAFIEFSAAAFIEHFKTI